MTGSNFELLEPEVIRGAMGGIYFGPRVHVILRCGERRLIWVPGHAAWSGTGQAWTYAASAMFITRPRDHYTRLTTGGRLKRALADHVAAIDAEFGEGAAKLIDPKRTLVLA